LQFFVPATAFWTLCISIWLYVRVVHNKKPHWVEKYFHVFCWGASLILSLPPWFKRPITWGPAGVWCWIAAEPIDARYSLFYAWIFAIMITICVIYVLIGIHVRGTLQSADREKLRKKVLIRLVAYPAVFVVVWLPATVNRIQNSAQPLNPIVELYVLHVLFVPMQGFLNAIAYGWNEGLVVQYKGLFLRILRRRRGITDSAFTEGVSGDSSEAPAKISTQMETQAQAQPEPQTLPETQIEDHHSNDANNEKDSSSSKPEPTTGPWVKITLTDYQKEQL